MIKEINKPAYLRKLKEEAAKQYVNETNKKMPSIENSDVTSSNDTDIVILRENDIIVGNYQHLGNYHFQRLDSLK